MLLFQLMLLLLMRPFDLPLFFPLLRAKGLILLLLRLPELLVLVAGESPTAKLIKVVPQGCLGILVRTGAEREHAVGQSVAAG